jgi:uncharacterized membrane protein
VWVEHVKDFHDHESDFLLTSTFLTCTVEMVEALTIVLATGITRGWRSALIGTLAVTAVLVWMGIPAWWVLPVGIAGYLAVSMTRK